MVLWKGKESVMSTQPMCKTCQSVVVQGGRGTTCVNCWEVESRICAYLRSSRGLRKVLAAIQNELSNDNHLPFVER